MSLWHALTPLLLWFFCLSLCSQTNDQESVPPPYDGNSPAASPRSSRVLLVTPTPVTIQGRRVDEMSDDELAEVLQQKVGDLYQSDGEVKILHVAPGYPLSLLFDQPYAQVVVGDEGLLKVGEIARGLLLVPLAREGDTSVMVILNGSTRYLYHVFIAPDFSQGGLSYRVHDEEAGERFPVGLAALDQSAFLDRIGKVIDVMQNYQVLRLEKNVTEQEVHRYPIAPSFPNSPFSLHEWFVFSDHVVGLSFTVENNRHERVKMEERRLRLVLGHCEFLPDYVSLADPLVAAHGSTTGLCLFRDPPFAVPQPATLNWSGSP